MTDSRKRQEAIDKTLLIMCQYYEQQLTDDVIEIYHLLWAKYETEDITSACYIWMEKSRWFPKGNEIIELIETQKGPQISLQTRAQQQWRVILQQLKRHGPYHPPQFSDPITAELVKNQFSWSYLANMKESEENWEQKRWCEAFELAADLYKDVELLDVPESLKNLLADTTKPIAEKGEPVPLDKITAFRKMLESQALKDDKALDKTNARLRADKLENE